MKGRVWITIGALALLAAAVAGCGSVAVRPTLGAADAAPVRGGGVVPSNGQFTEGLVVVGTGTVSAEPEVAQVNFGVELRGDDPAALVDEASRRIDRAIGAATELGIAGEDIRTVGYNLWVETIYEPERGMPTGEVAYHVSHHVEATLSDLDRVGELLAAVVDAGANTVSNVSFTVEDPTALVEQARQQALESAESQAQQMAEGLGIALGKPVLVTEIGGGYPVPVLERGVGGGVAETAAPSISAGTFSVSISVQIVYEIR